MRSRKSSPGAARGGSTPRSNHEEKLLPARSSERLQREAEACFEQVAARLGHAMRSPLTAIRAGAQLAQRLSSAQGTAMGCLAGIEEDALRLEQLARGLEALAGLAPEAFAPIDLEHLVLQALDDLRPVAQRRGIELASAGSRGKRAYGSAALAGKALGELLDNAVRYGNEGSRVHLRVHGRDGRMVLEISNACSGLAPRAEQRLFEPFISTSARAGLGLCRARRAALLAGGEVELVSSSKRGCRFALVLPGVEV